MRSTDLVSILCTDWVGSTATRSQIGEEKGDALQGVHDRIVREVITGHGGEVVKGTGDGVIAVFHSATDAIGAAVAIQQSIDAYSRAPDAIAPVELRIGIAVGDIVHRDGDIHGTPVIEAVRLQAAAATSQIVCSDVVRAMARGRGGYQIELLGMLELKGLPEPVPACEVRWERQAGPTTPELPLPADLASVGDLPFLGRSDELSWAAEQVGATDRPHAIWLMGEPGIGKTRLAAEVAARCHEGGVLVLFGRCDEEMAAPFQPVITALRWYAANLGDGLDRSALGADPLPLCRLVPEIATRVPGLGDTSAPASEAEQFRLFESVRGWLATASAERPLLFVIDDAHWADRPTLALIAHVLRGGEQARLTILGTARDTAPDRSGPLGELVDSLSATRRGTARRLSGLSEAEVSPLVGPDAAARLISKTAGNPLFLSAVLEDGSADMAVDALPGGVPAAVRRRLHKLPVEVQQGLQAASVLGPEVDLGVLAAMISTDETSALALVETACEAGLVLEVGVGRFRFAHALVRDAIAASVGATRATRLHAEAAAVIESRFAGNLEDQVEALAFHHAGAQHPDEALRYALQAADRAIELLAFDAAVEHYQMALTQCDRIATSGPATRFRLLLSKGRAERLAANHAGALDTLHDAALLAREKCTWEDYAYAVLGFEEASWRPGLRADEAATFLEDVLGRASEIGPAVRRLSASSLARSYHYTGRLEQARFAAAEALADARLGDDTDVLTHALTVSAQVLVPALPADTVEILEMASEAWGVRERLTDLDELATLAEYAVASELMRGDRGGTELWWGRLSSMTRVANTRFNRYVGLNMDHCLSFLAADLTEAERHCERSQTLGRQLGEDVSGVYGLQMFLVRREQDRLSELGPMVRLLLASNPVADMWRPGLLVLLAELGMVAEGRAVLEELVAGREHLRADSLRHPTLCFMAEGAWRLGMDEVGGVLAPLLREWRGAGVIVANHVSHLGATDRYLAMLARQAGRLEDAARLLESALAFNRGLAATLWEAHTLVDLAEVRRDQDRRDEAVGLSAAAEGLAAALDLPRVQRRCREIGL